jgi:hypothetical protein
MAERISKTFSTKDWLLIREKLRDKGVIDENWKNACYVAECNVVRFNVAF